MSPGPPGRAVLEWKVEVSETLRPLGLFWTLLGIRLPPFAFAVSEAVTVAESGRDGIANGRWWARELSVRAEDGKTIVPSPFALLFRVEPRSLGH